jgi:hypothetical protein
VIAFGEYLPFSTDGAVDALAMPSRRRVVLFVIAGASRDTQCEDPARSCTPPPLRPVPARRLRSRERYGRTEWKRQDRQEARVDYLNMWPTPDPREAR